VADCRAGAAVISKLLVANRGEIAVRIMRTCRDLEVVPVAVYSDPDASSRHVAVADESWRLPGSLPVDTYLNGAAIIDAALSSGADAVHPGYGFLAESADFARAVRDAGLIWVGPPPEAIASLGNKIAARRIASAAGVPVVPGVLDPVASADDIREFGAAHGYPVAIKAAAGGGGRGMRIVGEAAEVDKAYESARREARSYFGSDAVYVERYLVAPRHLEVQMLGLPDGYGIWLGVRDCSLQRRHQKLIEETPAPGSEGQADKMGAAAVALVSAGGYVNAGTVEFLVDRGGEFYFLEMNSRLQVEHTVTEEVFGVDLVASQLRIAANEDIGFSQADLRPRGHAIECRINAEDPDRFVPAPGRLTRFELPSGPGIRVDAGYAQGEKIPSVYDSLIAKVIAWGNDRHHALARMRRALNEFVVEGIATTIPAHLRLLDNDEFLSGNHTTRTVEATSVLEPQRAPADPPVRTARLRLWNPAMATGAPSAATDSHGELAAPMQGTIVEVRVAPGDTVEAGEILIVVEAMKMESVLTAPFGGKAVDVRAEAGAAVGEGEILVVIEPAV
jgi:acetyl-CoA/propionyl-CoA carboxylase, biotin carboxylase, biotin carboxyl carrier protein